MSCPIIEILDDGIDAEDSPPDGAASVLLHELEKPLMHRNPSLQMDQLEATKKETNARKFEEDLASSSSKMEMRKNSSTS